MYGNNKYKNKLQHKINFVFSITLAFTLLTVIVAGVWLTSSELIEKDRQLIQKVGESTVLNLEKQTLFAENIVATMAALAMSSSNIGTLKMQLDYQINALANNPAIASAGVWPLPYTLDSQRRKASLFWMRNDDRSFAFTDSYNDSNVPDYYMQEWFLPAQYLQNDGCYWSRSYIDDITKEPMVTCSKALHSQGKFQGVASIDISLKGLESNLQDIMRNTQGYALVLDRNDTFIATPSLDYQKNTLGLSRNPVLFESSLKELSEKDQRFSAFLNILKAHRKTIRNSLNPRLKAHLQQIAPDISPAESANIVNYLYDTNPQLLSKRLTVENDPLFDESAEIVLLHMPKTDWIVIMAIPKRLVLAKAQTVSAQLFLIMMVGVLLGALFLSYTLRKILVTPLRSMISSLRNQPDAKVPLVGNDDEIAELVEVFNTKQQALNKSNSILLEAKQRYQSILDTAIEGIITLDTDYRITDANPAALKLFSKTKDKLIHRSFIHMLDDNSHTLFTEWINDLTSSSAQQQELTLINKNDCRKMTVECSANYTSVNKQQFLTLFIRDITRRKANERKLKRLATKDSLTGLANRNSFNQQLSNSLKLADRHGGEVALLFIDLDFFKSINDNYGHNIGDKLLISVGRRIARERRSTDIVARLGGDEFAVILHHFDNIEVVCRIAEGIISQLKAPYQIDDIKCNIGASIGIAIYPENAQNSTDLVKQADLAMYRAKESGRNRWKLCQSDSKHQQHLFDFQ